MRLPNSASTSRVLLAALAAGLLIGASPATPPASSDLVILSLTDVKGKTSPCGCHTPKGGLSRQASFADSVRAENPRVLWVDNGGFFPETSDREDVARFLMDMMTRVGIQVANVGERDLSYGRSFLAVNARAAGLPLVSANLLDHATRKPAFEPWRVITMGGVKVGVFGLISDKVDLGPSRDSLEATEPSTATTKAVAALRAKGAKVIVCLSQLGKVESEDIAAAVQGIDVMIVGRNVPLIQQGRLIEHTLAVYGGEQGQYMGRSVVKLDASGSPLDRNAETFMLSPEVGENAAVLKTVKEFEDAFNARLREKEKERAVQQSLQHADESPDHFVGAEVCGRCHPSEYAQWKTTAHARAWQTLVDQKKDATPECVTCHVVGYKKPGGFQSAEDAGKLGNVQCENCHGMGTQHEAWPKAGSRVTEATCRQCHNETTSPKFDFAVYQPHVVHTPVASLPPLPPRSGKAPMMTGGSH